MTRLNKSQNHKIQTSLYQLQQKYKGCFKHKDASFLGITTNKASISFLNIQNQNP